MKARLASGMIACAQAGTVCGQGTAIPVSPVGPSQSNTLAVNIAPLLASQDRVKLWDALEQTAEPTRLLVQASQPVESAVRVRCGDAPPDLMAKLASLNPGLRSEPMPENRVLRFIPCPYWNSGVLNSRGAPVKLPTIPVRRGEAVGPIIQQYMGASGPENLAAVERLNPTLINGALGTIRANGLLVLPFLARPAIMTLTQTQTQDSAASSLRIVADSLPSNVRKGLSVSLSTDEYQLVAADDPSLADPVRECGGPNSFGDWPMDTAELEIAFNATLGLTPKQLFNEKARSVVAVADTGILLTEQVVRERLWDNLAYYGDVNDPTSPFSKDPHGASMVTMQGADRDIEPAKAYHFARHGTDIARILVEAGLRVNKLDKRFGIAIAKLNAQTPPYGIHVSSVPTALSYARRIDASVVNLSVVTGATSEQLEGAINSSDALIVSAAGNNGEATEALRVFPPALSIFREKFIVVGAHDWNGKLTSFSNFGKSVDILAPGCAIPVSIPGSASPRWVSGTSFAAPFVTFTAAMLQSLYFPANSAVVRSRILASGRFVPDLVSVTRYGVVLDVVRAVRYREDSYLPKDSSTPVYGTVDPVQNFFCQISADKSKNVRPRDVLKVIPRYPGAGAKPVPMIWTQPVSKGPFAETLCGSDFSAPGFRFKANGETEFKDVRWSDVDDIVMRATAK